MIKQGWTVLVAGALALVLSTSGRAADPAAAPAGARGRGVINTSFRLEIEFAEGKSDVQSRYDADIRRVVDYMKNYPYTKCEIRGYTDNVGSDTGNLKLSQARAESVRNYMIEKFGISSGRITARGFGKAEPVADNRTAEGRRQNRRIVAVITGQPPDTNP